MVLVETTPEEDTKLREAAAQLGAPPPRQVPLKTAPNTPSGRNNPPACDKACRAATSCG